MRMFSRSVFIWLCCASLVSTACGDGRAVAPSDPDAFAPTFSRELCGFTLRCGAEYPDLDTCVDRVNDRYQDGRLGYILDAVDDGRTRYVKDAATACLQIFEGADCDDVIDADNACADVFVGTQDEGAECNLEQECKPGLYCAADLTCPGACKAQAKLGQDCSGAECALELTCYDGVCQERLGRGEPCSIASRQCDIGLYCVDAEGNLTFDVTPGTCEELRLPKRAKLGEPCSWSASGASCDVDLACVPNDDATEYSCVKRIAGGKACRAGEPNACVAGHYCTGTFDEGDGNGTCEKLPAAGERCTDRGDYPCSPDLECFSDGVCRAPARVGAACDDDFQCASHSCPAGKCVSSATCMPGLIN